MLASSKCATRRVRNFDQPRLDCLAVVRASPTVSISNTPSAAPARSHLRCASRLLAVDFAEISAALRPTAQPRQPARDSARAATIVADARWSAMLHHFTEKFDQRRGLRLVLLHPRRLDDGARAILVKALQRDDPSTGGGTAGQSSARAASRRTATSAASAKDRFHHGTSGAAQASS